MILFNIAPLKYSYLRTENSLENKHQDNDYFNLVY